MKSFRQRIMENDSIDIFDVNIIIKNEEQAKLLVQNCGRYNDSIRVIERLESFFNAENVLTKSEYKKKIIGQENGKNL